MTLLYDDFLFIAIYLMIDLYLIVFFLFFILLKYGLFF